MSFTAILDDFKEQVKRDRDVIDSLGKTNPNAAFNRVNRTANSASMKYGVILQLHFLNPKKLLDVDSYATENISIVVDPKRKTFPIPRASIKEKAKEFLGHVETKDAYMYEGKEGAKVFLKNGRIDILPGSIHIWCAVDDRIRKFVDWLLTYCYGIKISGRH